MNRMIWGIVGALEEEIELLKEQMELEKTVDVYGCRFYQGTLRNHGVVLVCCGVGTINATVCTSVMIREFHATAVVNVGIAGCTSPDLDVLDVVIADELVFHDADLDILEKYYPFRSSFPTDEALRNIAVKAIESLPERSFQYKIGRIATGDAYVTDSARKEDIVHRTAPLCLEMEGAAVAQTAYMNGVPCLVIRSMSDKADEDADLSFETFCKQAANHSAIILMEILRLSR